MAIQFDVNRSAFQEMNSEIAKNHIHPMVNRIASNANAASSWGSYEAWEGDYVGRVSVLGVADSDSERARRLLALLGQESV